MTKVYVYALYNKDDEIEYVGKSNRPKERLYNHSYTDGYRKLKIMDIFYDKEYHWIQKLSESYNLKNKLQKPFEEDWNKGDIIEVQKQRVVSFIDRVSNRKFNSIKEASEVLGMSRDRISALLYNDNVRAREKLKFNFEILN